MKKLAISAAIIAALITPSVATAAEVPQVPANTSGSSGVTTEPMKVVKVKATKKGSAQIRATRTSCGEALKCAPQDAIYMVKIKVI